MELIGGLLTVAAFFLYGFSKAGNLKTSLEVLDSMLALLRELSARLSHRRESLKTVFSAYQDPLLESYGFLSLLKNHDGRDYPALWENALPLLPLPREALPPLTSLGASLGRLSLKGQTEQIALCLTLLEAVRKDLQAGAMQKRKSIVALWTLSGLLVALLLL